MSSNLELAMMMQGIIDMNPKSPLVPTLKAHRDQCIADGLKDSERERQNLDMLLRGADIHTPGPIVYPIMYGKAGHDV